jgi:hypothetical protein
MNLSDMCHLNLLDTCHQQFNYKLANLSSSTMFIGLPIKFVGF